MMWCIKCIPCKWAENHLPPPQPHSTFRGFLFAPLAFAFFFSKSFWHYFREVTNPHQSKGLIARILQFKTSRLGLYFFFNEHDNLFIIFRYFNFAQSFAFSTIKNQKNIITPPWNMTFSYRSYIQMSGGGAQTPQVLNWQKAQPFWGKLWGKKLTKAMDW